jgi:hypothetical protein
MRGKTVDVDILEDALFILTLSKQGVNGSY